MGISCCCKSKSKNKKQSSNLALANQMKKEEEEKQKRRSRVHKKFQILRHEIYLKKMKPYFQGGAQDHIQFALRVFKEDYRELKHRNRDGDQSNKRSVCVTYFIIDPTHSKFLPIWELVLLAVLFIEFALVPYTCCIGTEETLEMTRNLEFSMDIIFFISIIVTACTAFRKDAGMITDWKIILRKYMADAMIFDLCATIPTLATFEDPDFYYCKIARVYRVSTAKHIINKLVSNAEVRFSISKQTISKIKYFSGFTISLLVLMHTIACLWVLLGQNTEGSWIEIHELKEASNSQIYISAIYWVVTTLTTVGYGDFKGYTTNEYLFNMAVEFVGIAFFSFIMGSINNILVMDNGSDDEIESKIELVDVWLVKLDKTQKNKTLPKLLYDKIKIYITQQLLWDHNKLIKNYDFLFQLKPRLRQKIVSELFGKFKKDFSHLFNFQNFEAGEEFTSFFISALYCRIFIPNQRILKRGEAFAELYMIFQGEVIMSLSDGTDHEYFVLYSSNYFGDYQILFDYRAENTYTAYHKGTVYTNCLRKRDLLDLMTTFPDTKAIFIERAAQRRTEFRRIQNQYKKLARMKKDDFFEDEGKEAENIKVVEYTADNPPYYMQDPDFYLKKHDLIAEKRQDDGPSEIEQKLGLNLQEIEENDKKKTQDTLQSLDIQLDAVNGALSDIRQKLQKNISQTITFFKEANEQETNTPMELPQVENLQQIIYQMHENFQQMYRSR